VVSGGARQLVLVVTQDDFLADAVDQVLRNAGFAVERAERGPVEPLIPELRPALVVLDMGDEKLAERAVAVSRLRLSTDVPLVVLTRSDRLEDRMAGFEAGADDVLTIPFPLDELRWKVTTIVRRAGDTVDRLTLGDVTVDVRAHAVERNGTAVDLTAIEFALLVALGRHQGNVLSKTQLLTMVWGVDHHDVNLVEVHVSALRRKLEAAGQRVIHTLRGVGYVLRPAGKALDRDDVDPREWSVGRFPALVPGTA
jgi:two-component system, OmpR family, response regulator